MSTPIEVIDAVAGPAGDDGLGCLRTERGNLPLEAVDVRAAITGLASRTTITQTFRNPHGQPLEATYVFPLPSRSAVTRLRMEAAGRVVEGVLRERGEARADYDRAVAGGRRAAIAEEERPGVFTTRVGNVLPGERVTVRLTLAGVLAHEDGAATYRLPLVVAPRYVPGAPLAGGQVGDGVAADTDAVPDASRISPPVLLPGFPDPVRLSVEVDVDTAGLPPATPSATLHATVVERTGSGFRVRVESGARVDRDFLLRLAFADDDAVRTSLAVRPDEDGRAATFALTVLPPAARVPARGRDVVVVLDRSGSMHGWKMVAARRAAGRIVDSLGAGDRFAVLAFDGVVETPVALPAGLVGATDRNRYRAVEFLAGLDARGGTEMAEPLRRAAGLLGAVEERERVLVLVTDGQVGDEDRLLRELAGPLSGVRVHAVGVDRAVNEAFLHRLVGSTGRCELVESEDRLDEVMRRVHHRVGAPVLTGLAVRSAGLAVDEGTLTPWPLPDLFPGAPVVVLGRCATGGGGGVELSGAGGWRQEVPAVASDNPALAALWARSRVRDLEDRYVVGEDDPAELERRIVATSLEFGVLSRFTAFVAVDPRVVDESGELHRVVQPVEHPDGWGAPAGPPAPAPLAGGVGPAFAAAPGFAAPPAPATSFARRHSAPRRARSSADAVPPPVALPPAGAVPPAAPPPAAPPAAPEAAPEPLSRFLTRELDALRRTAPADAVAALSRLVAGIERLHPAWTAAGEPADHVRALRDLAAALSAALPTASSAAPPTTTDPARRLREAIAALEGLTAPRRRSFWKR